MTDNEVKRTACGRAQKILVTGASGFIGSHCVLELLNHGYEVRGSVRDLNRADELRGMLMKHNLAAGNMEFAAAELNDARSWIEAAQGCDGIFHAASPIPLEQPRNPEELIKPARQGTLNVLNAAKLAGIRRVILTSSVATVVGCDRNVDRTYSAEDWTDPTDRSLPPYSVSKVLAEQAAWDYISEQNKSTHNEIEISTINPALVLGPALERDYGSSLEAISKLLKGEVPMIPRFGFEIVDVRDVASLHRLAFEHPEAVGKRFLCGAGFMWFRDVARLLADEFPAFASKIPIRTMPNFLVSAFSLVIPELKFLLNDIEAKRRLDCTPAYAIGWQPRTPGEAILAGAKSLIELGIV